MKLLLHILLFSGVVFGQILPMPGPARVAGGGGGCTVSDTFTGMNGDALNVYSANWTMNSGLIEIQSNAAVGNSAGNSIATWNACTPTNDQYAEITIGSAGGTGFIGPAVRGAASGLTGYRCVVNNGGTAYIQLENAGSETTLNSGSMSITGGDVVRLEITGSSLDCKLNGVSKVTATDSTLTSGRGAISSYSTTNTSAASWAAGDLGGGGTPTLESSCTNSAGGTSITCTFSPHASGELLVVLANVWDVGTWSTITGSGGCPATFSNAGSPSYDTTSGVKSGMVWATGVSTGTSSCTVTATYSGGGSGLDIFVWDVSGATAADGSPGYSQGNNTGPQAAPAPTVTTSGANSLILTAMSILSTGVATLDAPFTQDPNSTTSEVFGSYLKASAGMQTPNFTFVGSDWWNTTTFAVKP